MTTERSAVAAAATEYFEAWFDGDGERMARILHPDLCKRRVRETLSFTTRYLKIVRDHDLLVDRLGAVVSRRHRGPEPFFGADALDWHVACGKAEGGG